MTKLEREILKQELSALENVMDNLNDLFYELTGEQDIHQVTLKQNFLKLYSRYHMFRVNVIDFSEKR